MTLPTNLVGAHVQVYHSLLVLQGPSAIYELVFHRFCMVNHSQPCTCLSRVTHNHSKWSPRSPLPPNCLGDVDH
jgi:hypothetical protein